MTQQVKTKNDGSKITDHPLKRYYRVDEVALYFSISVRTVYRLLDEGELNATRIRGCLRVSTEEVKRFEESISGDD